MSELDVLLDYMLGDKAVSLEYRFQKGESLKYRISLNSDYTFAKDGAQPEHRKNETALTLIQTVKAINYNDSFDLEIFFKEDKKITGNTESEFTKNEGSLRLRMLKNGRITHSSVGPAFSFPPFPERPLMKGESWMEENQLTLPGHRQAVPFQYTLTDFKEINGHECAVLEVEAPELTIFLEAGLEQKVLVKGVNYFDHQNGRLIKSEVKSASEILGYDWKAQNQTSLQVELVTPEESRESLEETEIPEEFMVVDPIISEKLLKKAS